MKVKKLSESSIRTTSKTRETVKELVNFFECHSQEEIVQHGVLALIDRELERTYDQNKIDYLCKLRKRVQPKIM